MSNIDFSWLFWAAILVLFAESWSRALVRTYRRPTAGEHGRTSPGPRGDTPAFGTTCCGNAGAVR